MILGIDAINIRHGGGRTHLIELLKAAQPQEYGFVQMIVWGSQDTLDLLEDRDWLIKCTNPALNAGVLRRSIWQKFDLSKEVHFHQCDVLFIPGGSYAGSFHPVVTMSQNLLPFEWQELSRYGWSLTTLKLSLLRLIQTRSFRRSTGVIFLTEYAKQSVEKVTGTLLGATEIIPHGLNPRFNFSPKDQQTISVYSTHKPYRLLYVSIIDLYKHQWHLIEAIARLRDSTGWPLQLDLVGPSYQPALNRLQDSQKKWDPNNTWLTYHGSVPYETLHHIYQEADLGIFASSCENLPNILLEMMAAGLPIACSNRGPMPEVLGSNGVYFDPENPADILEKVKSLIEDPSKREEQASINYNNAGNYSWQRCADQTFSFLRDTANS